MTSFEVPDKIGEVHGWRAWKIVKHPRLGLRLQSCMYPTVWPTAAWCHAECRKGHEHPPENRTPASGCQCGLYAAKTREFLLERLDYGKYDTDAENPEPRVIGEVAYAGKVVECSAGWRAEKGRILRIEVPYVFLDLAKPLETLYGIEVKLANTLDVQSEVARGAAELLRRRLEDEGRG